MAKVGVPKINTQILGPSHVLHRLFATAATTLGTKKAISGATLNKQGTGGATEQIQASMHISELMIKVTGTMSES